jgi:16S rRNA (cytosine967-C5)-methyltransferase
MIEGAAVMTAELLKFAQPADAALSHYFRAQKTGSRERAFIAETAYAVLRRRRWLTRLAGADANPGQLALAALVRIQGVNLRQFEGALDPDEMAWVVALKAKPEPELTLAEQADFPDWLAERLAARMSADEILELARALNRPASLDLRVNEFKAKREDVLAQFAAEGLAAEPCP